MTNNDSPDLGKKAPEIHREVRYLREKIDELEAMAEKLYEKTQCLRVPEPPIPVPSNKEVDEVMCPLAFELYTIRKAAVRSWLTIDKILGSIEV